jgi:hypothetical protein
MPATSAQIVDAATAEWDHWGRSTWNLITNRKKIGHTDDERAFAKYALEKYCSVVGDTPSLNDISNDIYFWSAVTISTIMKNAGLTKREYPFSNNHSVYIRAFVGARKASDASASYWGFRLLEGAAQPDAGDLIGYVRPERKTTFEQAQAYFDRTRTYPSHTDIVVARRPREIDVIGGNVLDSVTRKTVPLDGNGLVADRSHLWFVVLKRKRTP